MSGDHQHRITIAEEATEQESNEVILSTPVGQFQIKSRSKALVIFVVIVVVVLVFAILWLKLA